jgi:hypothetical protein
MTDSRAKRTGLLAVLFALLMAIALPTLANAQGRGHGRGLDKKDEKFRNGHDARDGRWDGRGPQSPYDRYDGDDDNYYRRGRNRRDRDDDRDRDDYYRRGRYRRDRDNGIFDRQDWGNIRRQAESDGYRAGFRAGSIDRANGERYNFRDEGAYYGGGYGSRNGYGNADFYRRIYRSAFERGYSDGYRRGRSRGGFLGNILGRY